MLKTQVHAMCPVCTVAVAAWIELSHYLGIDDTVTGLWIWWFLVSLSMWTINWLDWRNIRFFLKRKLTYSLYYASTLIPLYYSKLILHNPVNMLWWADKLLLGIGIWSLIFFFTAKLYLYMKGENGWRAYFPMQKVVMSIGTLGIASFIFYYITTYVYAI